MAILIVSDNVIANIDRLIYFLLDTYPEYAFDIGQIIIDGLQILKKHPLIGVKLQDNLRTLLISRGKSGYVALYEYKPIVDEVIIYAIKHQREEDF